MQEKSLGKWLSLLYRYSHIYLSEQLTPYDLGKGQALFLIALYHADGITQDELSRYLYIDKSTTARAIEKLVESGYAKKEHAKHDQRCKKVYLTSKAKKIEPHIQKILKQWTDILSKNMSDDEFYTAVKLLQKMNDNAIQHIKAIKTGNSN